MKRPTKKKPAKPAAKRGSKAPMEVAASVAATTPAPARLRRQDWPSRLFAFIEERRHAPFEWGRQDCCLFVCDGILTITGLDPAAKIYRGKYHDKLGAARLLKKHGGVEAVAEKVCAELGFVELPHPALAQRGDVAVLDTTEHGPALGLCVGAQLAAAGPDGLTFSPLGAARRAWRIH